VEPHTGYCLVVTVWPAVAHRTIRRRQDIASLNLVSTSLDQSLSIEDHKGMPATRRHRHPVDRTHAHLIGQRNIVAPEMRDLRWLITAIVRVQRHRTNAQLADIHHRVIVANILVLPCRPHPLIERSDRLDAAECREYMRITRDTATTTLMDQRRVLDRLEDAGKAILYW